MNYNVTKKIDALYLKNSQDIAIEVEKYFANMFDNFITISSIKEALDLFKRYDFHLILVNYDLPDVSSLDFIKEIVKVNPKIPIILISSFSDTSVLIEAINMGISYFIPKPVSFHLLIKVFNKAISSIILEDMVNKTKAQELELLKYKDIYNNMQHETALKKELHIIQNDMFKKYLFFGDNSIDYKGWQVDAYSESVDLVSGDTYTCKALDNGNIVIFLADAMGKGVSAAITSLISVSIVNYMVKIQNDKISLNSYEGLKAMLGHFIPFIRDNLLEDEVLSAIFAYFDFNNDKLIYSSFSMPRILYQKKDGSVCKLPSNNLPIMPYSVDIVIDSLDLSDVTKIAFFTDGLTETYTKENVLFSAYINEIFQTSCFLKPFLKNINKYIDTFSDDVSVFFIRRPYGNVLKEKHYEIPTRYKKLDEMMDKIKEDINDCGIDGDKYNHFFTAFFECIMNAYEHGNLAVGLNHKHLLIKSEKYEEELLKKEEYCDKLIKVKFAYCDDISGKYIIISVRDEGAGYPIDILKNNINNNTNFNGRGVKIINHYTDIFFFSQDGKEIFIGIEVE